MDELRFTGATEARSMSSCIGCVCNACAYNVNLDLQYFTPGEIEDCCFNCDDCIDGKGKGRWMPECDHFLKPAKRVEMEARIARSKFKIIGGNKRE